MSFKLSLKTSQPAASDAAAAQTPGSARPKIKLTASQPATPAIERSDALAGLGTQPKKGKKRAAGADAPSPAAKRVASEANRRTSLILKVPSQQNGATSEAPQSAGPKLKLAKRQPSAPKQLYILNRSRQPPKRVYGNAYDSEDSDRELDPAEEQQIVLRMQPGEDCDLLRKAITDRTIGLSAQEGGVDVGIKFLDSDLRRALVTVQKNMYAAILVDLPCIVETMKSWDKRGWWKVCDISQMLLVLGRVQSDEQAKTYALPERVLNEKTWAYAHGLTPPMHWVRKRRFRKRLSYKDNANVEDEVNKLIAVDEEIEAGGGQVDFEVHSRQSIDREAEARYQEDDDEAIDTIEGDYDDAEEEEMDVDEAEAQMQALFDQELAEQEVPAQITSAVVSDSPVALNLPVSADRYTGTPIETPTTAQTPAENLFNAPANVDDEDESSDEDEDDDDIDAYDEDAQARAAEQNIQQQEIQDLENEINLQRQKLAATKNQLLLQRQRDKLKSLEEDLAMKRRVYGLDDEDED